MEEGSSECLCIYVCACVCMLEVGGELFVNTAVCAVQVQESACVSVKEGAQGEEK